MGSCVHGLVDWTRDAEENESWGSLSCSQFLYTRFVHIRYTGI